MSVSVCEMQTSIKKKIKWTTCNVARQVSLLVDRVISIVGYEYTLNVSSLLSYSTVLCSIVN